MTRIEKKYDVFISYSHADKELASSIHERLVSSGISCFFDVSSIKGRDYWIDDLTQAIKQSRVFLVLLSSKYDKSDWAKRELNFAIKGESKYNIAIFPYLIEESAKKEIEDSGTGLMLGIIQWVSSAIHPLDGDFVEEISRAILAHQPQGSDLVRPEKRPGADELPRSKKTLGRGARFAINFSIGMLLMLLCVGKYPLWSLLLFIVPFSLSSIRLSSVESFFLTLLLSPVGGYYILFNDIAHLSKASDDEIN